MKNIFFISIGIFCLCFLLYSCQKKKNSADLKFAEDINLPVIDEFSNIVPIKINRQERLLVYSLQSDKLRYAFMDNKTPNDQLHINAVKLSNGYRFLGIAGKYFLTYEGSLLQIIDLEDGEVFSHYEDFPYGNFVNGSMAKVNSSDPVFYSNYSDKSLRQRRHDCSDEEYFKFLKTILSKRFISRISFSQDSIFVDTFLTGMINSRILDENSFANHTLGVEDFGDSLCLYSSYSDSIYFYNKNTNFIKSFSIDADLAYFALMPVSYDLMKEDYNEFIDHLTKDNLRFASIYCVKNDPSNNLLHLSIIHDKIEDVRNFTRLIYKNGEKIVEKEFDGELYSPWDSFIFEGQIYLKKVENEENNIYKYSIYNVDM